MCRFKYRARRKKLPVKKVTRWATSSHGIYSALDLWCRHQHEHGTLEGRDATDAAIYTDETLHAIVDGIIEDMYVKESQRSEELPDENQLEQMWEQVKSTREPYPKVSGFQGHDIWVDQDIQTPQSIGQDRGKMRSVAVRNTNRQWIWMERCRTVDDPILIPQKHLDHEYPVVIAVIARSSMSPMSFAGALRSKGKDEDHAELTEVEKREVTRHHINMGHPCNAEMIRLFKAAGAKPSVLIYVRDHFQCEGCRRQARPPSRLPAATPRVFDFNIVIGSDLLSVAGISEEDTVNILNITCWGTRFSVFIRTDQNRMTAAIVWISFLKAWVRVFGPPQILIVDQGTAFVGDEFMTRAEALGILVEIIDRDSVHENAITERHGANLKRCIIGLVKWCNHPTISKWML